jgi:hypothetical protein
LIREHGVCWRLGPFSEPLGGGDVVEAGYELVLLGRFHPAGPAEVDAEARALHEHLRELALQAIGDAPPDVSLCILPLEATLTGVERLAIEVELVVIGKLAHPHELPVAGATRQRIVELEAGLRALGLPPRREFAR